MHRNIRDTATITLPVRSQAHLRAKDVETKLKSNVGPEGDVGEEAKLRVREALALVHIADAYDAIARAENLCPGIIDRIGGRVGAG